MNETAAVVVTYNRKDLLRKCLTRLLSQQDVSCDVVLVDNASTDGTGDMVKEEFNTPQIQYFNTGKNGGGCRRL